jgi:hypothetical protein
MLRNGVAPHEAARRALEGAGARRPKHPTRREPVEPQVLKSATKAALSLLLHELQNGPRPSREIEDLATAHGIGQKALKAARRHVCSPAIHRGNPGAPRQFWMVELRETLPSWLSRRGVTAQ